MHDPNSHTYGWRRLMRFVLLLIAAVCLPGCSSEDQFHRSWELRPQANPHAATHSEIKNGTGHVSRQIKVGMSKNVIREIADPLIEESSKYVWKLKDQFRSITPGLYPYFDTREVFLYFDDDDPDTLAAIIVRGDYNVYP